MNEGDPPDAPGSGGPALNADGSLEGRLARVEPAGPPPEEKLELAEVAPKVHEPRVENFRPVVDPGASRRRRALAVVLGLVAVGLCGAGALLYFQPKLEALPIPDGVREATLLDSLSGGAAPLIISSTPTGATILIEGTEIGRTPWAGENRWRGAPKLVLRLPGYRDWEGTFKGEQPQTLDLRLKK